MKKLSKHFLRDAQGTDVYERISRELGEAGFIKSWKQCRDKMKKLKSEYKRIKDHNGITEKGRKGFKFYDYLIDILGTRPAMEPPVVIDTLADVDETVVDSVLESEREEVEEESDCVSNSPPDSVVEINDAKKDEVEKVKVEKVEVEKVKEKNRFGRENIVKVK